MELQPLLEELTNRRNDEAFQNLKRLLADIEAEADSQLLAIVTAQMANVVRPHLLETAVDAIVKHKRGENRTAAIIRYFGGEGE